MSCLFAWTICSFKLSWHCGNALRQAINLQQDHEPCLTSTAFSNAFTNRVLRLFMHVYVDSESPLSHSYGPGFWGATWEILACECGQCATLYYRKEIYFCCFVKKDSIRQAWCQTSLAYDLGTVMLRNLNSTSCIQIFWFFQLLS